ncbi:MAG: hypothetical protein HZA61_06485 [Candidatus Eisenbacteria bacterium]|uniref:SMP-30/Gluconolactonase/LRE-like region domain-containing protein n=1 Tax=Eiseniibacteriota bacterium TaxID=2212470 RepID=A0A933SCZ4_UNCEI|nr:hypothetical protein [Candidatus Eisenbacteria bacterium]
MTRRALFAFALAASFCTLAAPPRAWAILDEVHTYATITGAALYGVAFDDYGNLFVAGSLAGAGKVWKVGPGGSPVTEFATGFVDPRGLAFDTAGNLFVSDYQGNKIYKVSPAQVKTTFVASITSPAFLEFGPGGNLFVAEWGQLRVQVVSPAGVVSNYATAVGALGEEVSGMVYDPASGDLYVGAGPNLKRIGAGGSPVNVFATGLIGIFGLARDAAGTFYASRYSHRDVYEISTAGAPSPYAGVHLASGCLDGPRLSAKFIYTAGVTVHQGTLYIADQSCHTIRAIDIAGAPTPAVTSTWGRVKTMYR